MGKTRWCLGPLSFTFNWELGDVCSDLMLFTCAFVYKCPLKKVKATCTPFYAVLYISAPRSLGGLPQPMMRAV